jgi:putative hydrolase of the HAD superfamily
MQNTELILTNTRAVLLDLDDTILMDSGIGERLWLAACGKYAPLAGNISAVELRQVILKVANHYWSDPDNHRRGRLDLKAARRYVVSQAFLKIGLDNPEAARELADMFTAEKEKAITPFPGALETLDSLKSRGKRLGLLTNGASDAQRWKIDKFGLEPYFDYICIEGEFGVGKPNSRVFQGALNSLKVEASEACMIGNDLEHDISGAQRLEIPTVWVDIKGQGLPADASVRPDYTIRTLSDLMIPDTEAIRE